MSYFCQTSAGKSYAVVLVASEKDRHCLSLVIANELAAAFQCIRISVYIVDYMLDIRRVSDSLRDADCKFFVCFNGFGSELLLPYGEPGELASAFEYYKKPLFDLMHNCPVHDSMRHQLLSTGGMRNLLCTDYSYAHQARLLGVANVRFVSSITFPLTVGNSPPPLAARPIKILLPIGLSSVESVSARHAGAQTYRGRIYREIFECVTERALSNLGVDPLIQTLIACQELGLVADFGDADMRFLISSIVDYVKFKRRRQLLEAVKHLPITVVADHDLQQEFSASALEFIGEKSFPDLVKAMTHSKSVICPLPHHTGFHERALAAFTAGALVVAAPNEILETQFVQGEDMFTYRSLDELALTLERALSDELDLQPVATGGQMKALERFSPNRLVTTIVSLFESSRRTQSN